MEENTAPPSFTPPPAAPPPPPLTPPPVIVPPSSTPPRRRGRGWMIFALVLLVLLGISVLANLGHLLSSFSPMKMARVRPAGPRLEEVITEDNDASTKIVVVEVDGIITSRAMDQGGYSLVDVIKAQLKRAEGE